jgi:CubicO group peptidase (beta-lactamase class C family)
MGREKGILSVDVDEIMDLLAGHKTNGRLMDSFGPREKRGNVTEFNWKNMKY